MLGLGTSPPSKKRKETEPGAGMNVGTLRVVKVRTVPLHEGGMVMARSIFGLPLCLLPGLFEVNQVIEWTSN